MNFKKVLFSLILVFLVLTCTSCIDSSGSDSDTEYTITYHVDGGTIDEVTQKFKDHNDVTLPIPTKEGYNFVGWYNESGIKINKAYANKDYVLYAKWVKKTIVEKEYFNEFGDVELIESVEITNDGLLVHMYSHGLDALLSYDVVLTYGNATELLITSDNAFVYPEGNVFVENLENNYTDYISVRIYYEEELAEQVRCYYSKIQVFKISDLVTKELNELEKTILDANNIIYEIRFSLNTTTYKVSSSSSKYTTKLKKDYVYIYVTVTANDNYTIYKDVDLYVNDVLETKYYTISSDQTVLSYTIDDPNWTGYW